MMENGTWAGAFLRHLLPSPGNTSPGTWLAVLSGRAFALLRTLEAASPTERLCGKICWNQFHHRMLGETACRLVESEVGTCDVPLELATRRHQDLLRLVRMQLREAFGTSEHSHPACLAHRTLAELEPVLGCPFSEDLLGGSIQRDLRRGLALRPGILPAARILLETCTASVADYWTGRRAADLPERRLVYGPEPAHEFPEVYC